MKVKYKKGYCVICYKDMNNDTSLLSFFKCDSYICNKCKNSFKTLFEKESILGVETIFLYEYNTFLKSIIYRYKGCYDIVLKDVFLYNYKHYIKNNYKDYTIIYPPSNRNAIEKRGYDHMFEMVSILNMKVEDLFYKKIDYKQSDQRYKDRYKIKDIIDIKHRKIENKKYLIIDDIFTSGSTLKHIIYLLTSKGVNRKNIKALIVAKTKDPFMKER